MSTAIRVIARRLVPLTIAAVGALGVPASVSQAAVKGGVGQTFPASVTVGDTAVEGQLVVGNYNSAPDNQVFDTVCNGADNGDPCFGQGITLVPACSQRIADDQCAAGATNAGVFSFSPTATGRLDCEGVTFDVFERDLGMVQFTPRVGHVVLAGTGIVCGIDYTFAVLRVPAGDVNPRAPGVQVTQIGKFRQTLGAIGLGAATASPFYAIESTVAPATSSPTPPPPPPPEPPPGPCTDCDGDGYPSRVDCDDADPRIHPGARDTPGNKRDEDCSGHDAAYPRVDATFSYRFQRVARFTVFTSLHVHRVRAGSTVTLGCTGKGCTFKRHTRKLKRAAADVNLSGLVNRMKLRPRTRLEVRVTQSGRTGLARRFTVYANADPASVDRCLPPGSTRAVRCPL